jgi:hypothetical protein
MNPVGLPGAQQPVDGPVPQVPAMPDVPRSKLYRGAPYLLVDSGVRHSIGWRDDRRAGPSFVVARLSQLDTVKVEERFPLTEQGWEGAWLALAGRDLGSARAVAARLAQREAGTRTAAAVAALDAQSLYCLRHVTFAGGSGGPPLARRQACDLRFLGDRIAVHRAGSASAIVEVPYRDAEIVDVGGPGHVGMSTGELLTLILGLALVGAVLGLLIFHLRGLLIGALAFGLIGAVAGAVSIKTEAIVRIRRGDGELYFVCLQKRPDALRIELSEPLEAIRRARAGPASDSGELAQPAPRSIPDQLSKLASLLQQGLISRDEFEQLKAKLIASS